MYLVLVTLTLLIVMPLSWSVCPAKELIEPCTCKSDKLQCVGHQSLDLLKIFDSLRKDHNKVQNHFKELILSNTEITELKTNTFKGFNFGEIHIKNCTKLKAIQKDAFNTTDLLTTYIAVRENPALTSSEVFHELSKFKKVGWIDLGNNNMSEIPSFAFNNVNGYQKELTGLGIFGSSFEKLGEHPFYHLNSLVLLQLLDTSIETIPPKTFSFEQKSNKSLTIRFLGGPFMKNYNFSTEAFLSINRATMLMIDRKAYLDEHVFLPFLKEDHQNSIESNYDLKFDCEDCRNYWIKKDHLEHQIKNLKCSNGKDFDDKANFLKCT